MQYKWKVLTIKNTGQELEKLLSAGWEVVHVAANQQYFIYILRITK